MDIGTASIGTDFHTGTGQVRKFGTTSIPVLDTSVTSVQHQTGTGRFGNFGTTSIPVPDTAVSSVRHGDIDTGTAGTGTDFHTGTG